LKSLCQSVVDVTIHRDSVSSEEGAWPTGHRASPTRGDAVAPVRRPWPHRPDHGAFKTATTRRGGLHSFPLPLPVSKRQNRAAIAAPPPASSRACSTASPATKSRQFLRLTTLHLLDPPAALIELKVSPIVTSAIPERPPELRHGGSPWPG
jgi:hypothetical protein